MESAGDQLEGYWATVENFFAFDTALLFEPGMIALLVLQVFLLCCSAFFSGSETALFSLSRLDLQKLRRDRHPRSETLHALLSATELEPRPCQRPAVDQALTDLGHVEPALVAHVRSAVQLDDTVAYRPAEPHRWALEPVAGQ